MCKKISIIVLILTTTLFSCKSKNEDKSVKQITIKDYNKNLKKDCSKQIDIEKIKIFFDEIKKTCIQDSTKISTFLTNNIDKHYYKNFCSLLTEALKEIEGEEEYTITEDSGDCKGFININSVNFYDDGEEKHRNEYSTFLYLIFTNDNKILIDKIEGAG